MPVFSFRKDEILRKKKLIERLFAAGNSFFIYPFKIIWIHSILDTRFPAQILISVSKRSFKNATDRNRIKRLIREAYRKNKHPLYQCLTDYNLQGAVAIIYTSNSHMTAEEVETKIKAVIKRLITELNKKLNNPSSALSDNKSSSL